MVSTLSFTTALLQPNHHRIPLLFFFPDFCLFSSSNMFFFAFRYGHPPSVRYCASITNPPQELQVLAWGGSGMEVGLPHWPLRRPSLPSCPLGPSSPRRVALSLREPLTRVTGTVFTEIISFGVCWPSLSVRWASMFSAGPFTCLYSLCIKGIRKKYIYKRTYTTEHNFLHLPPLVLYVRISFLTPFYSPHFLSVFPAALIGRL